MINKADVPDGLYRLVKWREDGNPVFPCSDTVVEVRAGRLINLSTGRSWPLSAVGIERSLYGPLKGPYDGRRLKDLRRIDLDRPDRAVRGVMMHSFPQTT